VILACYLLCLPTYRILKVKPVVFFIIALCFFILTVLFREGSLYGIYNKISSSVIYRFLYHYIVFALALHMGIVRNENMHPDKKWICLTFAAFFLYLWIQPIPYFGIIAVGLSILSAVCVIQIIFILTPFVEKHLPVIFILSPITYELYLVHYSVIGAINIGYHGKLISYPFVFISSIMLAYFISILSKQYKRLLELCSNRLLKYTINKL